MSHPPCIMFEDPQSPCWSVARALEHPRLHSKPSSGDLPQLMALQTFGALTLHRDADDRAEPGWQLCGNLQGLTVRSVQENTKLKELFLRLHTSLQGAGRVVPVLLALWQFKCRPVWVVIVANICELLTTWRHDARAPVETRIEPVVKARERVDKGLTGSVSGDCTVGCLSNMGPV